MNNSTFFDLFSGGGGAAEGAKKAGLKVVGGVEIDKAAAGIYTANHGNHLTIGDILKTTPTTDEEDEEDNEKSYVTVLHASPVCKHFSEANPDAGEHPWDLACARKIAEYITAWKPQYFTLENVPRYAKSDSLQIILRALTSSGYYYVAKKLNSADFGVPQARKRLMVLAVRGRLVPPMPPPRPWVGWHEAIADLLPGLPDTELADWQIRSLRKTKNALPTWAESFLFNSQQDSIVPGPRPAFTITEAIGKEHPIRALLVENTGAWSGRPLQRKKPHEPCWTLRAMGHDGHWHAGSILEKLESGRCRVALTSIQCLARFQSFPDSYIWTGKKSVDGAAIGNSICPLFYERVLRTLLGR